MPIAAVPKFITEAHARWKFCSNSETAQRSEESEDLDFDALRQWPKDIKDARAGDESKRVPARPCLTISLLGQPISQLDNAQEQAQFSPTVKPKQGKTSKKVAAVAQGLLRHIQNHSHALEASMWGAKRANRCGRGYWMITARYVDDPDIDGPEAYDQELHIDKILNQFCVYFDPTAKQPNKRDARWVIITDTLTQDEYEEKYGTSDLANATLEEWADIGTEYPGWISTDDKGTRTYRIAHYIRIKETVARVVLEVKRGVKTQFLKFDLTKGEKPEVPQGWRQISKREIKTRKVLWDIINAVESLKTFDWPGQWLPLIEMVVEEKNVNGERIYSGAIRPSKDAQRSYNYMRSAQVETIALAPRAPYTADMRAIGQYKKQYDTMNTHNYSVAPYDSVDVNGDEIPDARPKRDVSEPAIQAVTMAAQAAVSDVRATTMIPEVSLGQTDPRYRAQGAIRALQGQSDLATSGFLIAYKNAKAWECEVLLDLIPHYYDRPGRIIEILTGEPATSQSVMLGQHFTINDEGYPEPSDESDIKAEIYDLTQSRFTVEVAMSKNFPTQRAEQQANIAEMMATSPEVSRALAPLAMKYSDAPGSQEAFKVLKTLLWPPTMQGDENTAQPDPRQLMGQMQQMQQQMQQMQQELQEAKAGIPKAIIDAKTKVEVAHIQAASAGAVAETKVNADFAEAIIGAEVKKAELATEDRRTQLEATQQHHETVLQHAHERGTQIEEYQHAKDVIALTPKPEKKASE